MVQNQIEKIFGNDLKTNEVSSIILDNKIKISHLSMPDKEYLEKFDKLTCLCLNFCGIKSLENFPNLPKLLKVSLFIISYYITQLELSDNHIEGKSLMLLNNYTNLTNLILSNNPISDLGDIESINLGSLRVLDISDTPVALKNKDKIKTISFKHFPSLQIFNGKNIDGESVMSSEDEEDEEDEYEEDDAEFEEYDEEDELNELSEDEGSNN